MLHVGLDAAHEVRADLVEERRGKPHVLLDGAEALDDRLDGRVGVVAVEPAPGALDEEIRHLGVVLVALAGGRDDDDAPLRVGADDVDDLLNLGGVGDGASAELANFHGEGVPSFLCGAAKYTKARGVRKEGKRLRVRHNVRHRTG